MAMFCGRCGAQVAPGSPFCGRCGAPVVQAVAAPIYSYPVAAPARYPTGRRFGSSQVAIAGVLLAILAIVTVGVTAFAVSQALGGKQAVCTGKGAPHVPTHIPE